MNQQFKTSNWRKDLERICQGEDLEDITGITPKFFAYQTRKGEEHPGSVFTPTENILCLLSYGMEDAIFEKDYCLTYSQEVISGYFLPLLTELINGQPKSELERIWKRFRDLTNELLLENEEYLNCCIDPRTNVTPYHTSIKYLNLVHLYRTVYVLFSKHINI